MSVVTYEGMVENGQIRLTGDVRLPENGRVYVLVPDPQDVSIPRVVSPPLVDPRDAARVKMAIVVEPPVLACGSASPAPWGRARCS